MVDIEVLTPVQQSKCATPVFIIAKKDDTIWLLMDYRKVNKLIKQKPYPLPCIANTLQELEGFQYASALDLNMGYYTIWLAPGAKELTTIITEFG